MKGASGARAAIVFWAIAIVVYIWYSSSAAVGGFVFDDYREVVENPAIKQSVVEAVKRQPFRALQEITYRFDYMTGGTKPRQFHITNIAIHLMVALTVSLFWGLMFKRFGLADDRDMFLHGSIVGSTFLFHPLNLQAFSYISARSEMLAAFFIYAALCVLVWPGERIGSARRIFSVTLLVTLALLCKESAAIAFFIVAWAFSLLGITKSKRAIGNIIGDIKPMIPVAIVTAIWVAFRLSHKIDLGPGVGDAVKHSEILILGEYWKLLMSPIHLSIDHGDLPLGSVAVLVSYIFGSIGIACILSAGALSARPPADKNRPLWFCLVAFNVFLLLPSLVSLKDAIAEHRAYMAAGSFCALPAIMILMSNRVGALKWSHAIVAILFIILGAHEGHVWKSEESLWANAVRNNPDNARAWYGLGSIAMENGRTTFARMALEKSLAIDPSLSKPESDLGLMAMDAGDNNEAARRFRNALKKNPADWRAMVNLATLLELNNESDEALRYLQQAMTINDKSASVWFNMGNVLGKLGRKSEARQAYERAMKLDPEGLGAPTNLALLYESENNYSKALALLDDVLRKAPNFPPALLATSRISAENGDLQNAIIVMGKYLSIRNTNAVAWRQYADLLNRVGRTAEAEEALKTAESLNTP